jgi:Na+/proline symporter
MSLPLQIMFFGALVSAILSTTSSAIMAPAAILGENIVKFFKPELTDKQLLAIIRIGIVVITAVCIYMASTRESILSSSPNLRHSVLSAFLYHWQQVCTGKTPTRPAVLFPWLPGLLYGWHV